MQLKPLVVGAPRSGFTLLISVIIEILTQTGKLCFTNRQRAIQIVVQLMGAYLSERYRTFFQSHGIDEDLIISGEFGFLLGGPKWIDPCDHDRLCIRKYIGVRGVGDFLYVTSHPREIFDYYAVLHSHSSPSFWVSSDDYRDYVKLTSIREPVGIIHSSCHSINALSSEYIQRYVDEDRVPDIRLSFALYKLTDLKFFRSLAKYLKTYLDDYLKVHHLYNKMKWEDLILEPGQTIAQVAGYLGIDELDAEAIWEKLAYRNLTEFHKHNYRPGAGKIHDWKNYMINEHLDILKELGFDEYNERLGYDPVPCLDEASYNEFQKAVLDSVKKGRYSNRIEDPNLFDFGFNKTNISPDDYHFESLEKKAHTQIERFNFKDRGLLLGFYDMADAACADVNRVLETLKESFAYEGLPLKQCLANIRQQCARLCEGVCDDDQYRHLFSQMDELIGHS